MVRTSLLALAVLCASCTAVVNSRGYLADPATINSIAVGQDTKISVSQRLGNPSTQASFDNEVWYYISSREEQVAFFTPRVTERNVLAVEFNGEGKVEDVRRYELKDGRIVAFVTRETPTKGKELTILQQMLNAVPGAARSPEGQPRGGY